MTTCIAEDYPSCRIDCDGDKCIAVYDPDLDRCFRFCGVSDLADVLGDTVRTNGINAVTTGQATGMRRGDISSFTARIVGVIGGIGVNADWAEAVLDAISDLRIANRRAPDLAGGYGFTWKYSTLIDILELMRRTITGDGTVVID